MESQRTEEDKLLRAGIVVILGGVEYSIPPLVIREAAIWRKKLASLLGKLPAYASTTTDNPAAFETAITAMLVSVPDEMTDLFFSYAKGLDRQEIEGTANEIELATAFGSVLKVAFPLVAGLTEAMGKPGR
jgi:hypothetical protein